MTGHLDPDVLADFREGLLGRRHSARVRAHLDTCPACAALGNDLAQVTELLASAPAPKMPDQLIARLENALAAEAAARTANPDLTGEGTRAADAVSGAAHSPDRRPRRTGRRSWPLRPATLGVAAAIAAVLAVGGYGLSNLHSGANHPASSAAGAPAHRPTGNLRPSAKGAPNDRAVVPSSPMAQMQVIESGTNYLPGRLASQARSVLASHPVNAPRQGPLTGSGTTSQLQSCVDAVTGGRSPLLVDKAHYQGRPATVIVLQPTASRAGEVWVTGPTCSATNPGLIAHTQLPTG